MKVIIDHNNDSITILPTSNYSIGPESRACKFIKVKDTNMIEKIIYEIFNTLALYKEDNGLEMELESINEDNRSSECW